MNAKYKKLVIIAGAIVIADQVAKAVILHYLPLYETHSVVPGFFNITHIQNPGGAFGFFADKSLYLRKILFLFFSTVAVCLIFYFYKHTPKSHPMLATGLALIFGGAIGNLIDRFRFGMVVDFLDFFIGHLHWPAFNIADSAITVGIAIFIFHIVFKKMPESL